MSKGNDRQQRNVFFSEIEIRDGVRLILQHASPREQSGSLRDVGPLHLIDSKVFEWSCLQKKSAHGQFDCIRFILTILKLSTEIVDRKYYRRILMYSLYLNDSQAADWNCRPKSTNRQCYLIHSIWSESEIVDLKALICRQMRIAVNNMLLRNSIRQYLVRSDIFDQRT